MAATWLSFVGDVREAQRVWDRGEEPPSPAVPLPDEGSLVDAAALVVERARDRQIVMINEAHHVPQHREFTHTLLRSLRELGFHTLALETLTNEPRPPDTPHPMEALGQPTFVGGYYLQEPAFAALVRTALDLGFHLVSYEARSDDLPELSGIARREEAQARHLADYLRAHPSERVLVHLGYSHLSEKPLGDTPWMAARLRTMLDVDPLTVDQTRMSPRSEPRFEDPRYVAACERYEFEKPSVLLCEDGTAWTADEAGLCDLTVFHPRVRYENDRPSWLHDYGLRRAVAFEDLPLPHEGSWFLLQAFDADEDPRLAIPVDQFVLRPGNVEPTLHLPAGRHQVRLLDDLGEILWEEESE